MTTSSDQSTTRHEVSWQRRFRVWWRTAQVWVIAGAFLAVYGLGVYGAHEYLQESDPPARLTDSLYMALQCFTLENAARGGIIGYPIAFQVARFLGPLVLAYATVYALLRIFRRQLDRLIAKLHRDHIIVCGLGEQGQIFTENAVKQNRKVAVIDQSIDRHSEAVRRLRELGGAPILVGDATQTETLKAAGIHRADQVVVLCGSDDANGRVIAAIAQAVQMVSRSDLMVMVQIMNIELAEQLQLDELRYGPRPDSLIVDFGCLPSLAATRLLSKYPPIEDSLDIRDSPKQWPLLVIVGSGMMAEAMLIAIAQKRLLSASASEDPFGGRARVIVADDKAEAMVRNVNRRHPRISTILDISCVPLHECLNLVVTGDEVVYVCLDDEPQGAALGLSMQTREVKPACTVLQTWSRHSLLEVTAGCVSGKASIHHVGILDAMDDIDDLLGSPTERFAQAIHADYCAGEHARKESSADWKSLDALYKDQNRDQAVNFQSRLREIGAHIVPSLSILDQDVFTFKHSEVDYLAKREHERWMLHEKANGYRPGPRGSGRNEKAKTHGDLVPFDELDKHEREKDRQPIRNIPRILWRAGYGIARRTDDNAEPEDRSTVGVSS